MLPLSWGHVHLDITEEVARLARSYGIQVTKAFRFRASPDLQNPELGYILSPDFTRHGEAEGVVGFEAKDVTILHEVLHIQHPDWDEYTVEVTAQVLYLAGRVW